MSRPNSYLVGGRGLPMKFVRAESVSEARAAWRKRTGFKKGPTPPVALVTLRKARPREKRGGEK